MLYKEAGVDIDAADEAKRRIGAMVNESFGDLLPAGFGGFGSFYRHRPDPEVESYLVSSVDSVGTKVKVAILARKHDTVGVDIVNHCVNDILVCGASPLFFMDYIATGKLDPDVVEEIVKGLVSACREAGCPLIGGETAEMPGLYADGDYDLVGFIVGAVDRDRVIDGRSVEEGDVIIGLASSGLHTNGYSLARKIFFEECGYGTDTYVEELGSRVGEALLATHRSYLKPVKHAIESCRVKSLAHITGGGFSGNLPRVFPRDLDAVIRIGSWPVPRIFDFIRDRGGVPRDEMYRTFNMGIGMTMTVSPEDIDGALAALEKAGSTAWNIGRMTRGNGRVILEEA